MKIVLANMDYRTHMTSEGNEFQLGLEQAGWTLTGIGFDDRRDVPELLRHYKPEAIIVHDKRDWDPHSGICYRGGIDFKQLGALASYDAMKFAVVKDAGSSIDYHRRFCEEIQADAVITYYHESAVTKLSPWMCEYELIRTYHSVDSDLTSMIEINKPRQCAIVSGATSQVYPLRNMVIDRAGDIGCRVLRFPGYGNGRCYTPSYLREISEYRVHIATASAFQFALRKIIESVAVGTTPVTNLPTWDILPQSDEALVRVSENADWREVRDAVDYAERTWNSEERAYFAAKANHFYDYRALGARLSQLIAKVPIVA